jgi:hypothetical protein
MRRLALLLLLACSDGEGPNAADVAGTWSGAYTNSASPGDVFQAILQLEQEGTAVTGTLSTTAGRTATIDGQVDEETFSATLTYTDACEGTAATEASVQGGRLVGEYTSDDCVGETVGNYTLTLED